MILLVQKKNIRDFIMKIQCKDKISILQNYFVEPEIQKEKLKFKFSIAFFFLEPAQKTNYFSETIFAAMICETVSMQKICHPCINGF
jgi:hypothetical protein